MTTNYNNSRGTFLKADLDIRNMQIKISYQYFLIQHCLFYSSDCPDSLVGWGARLIGKINGVFWKLIPETSGGRVFESRSGH